MIIVSLTSWPKRIGNVATVLKSIVEQDIKADLIQINLSRDEFLDIKDIKEFLSNDKFNNYNCIRVCWRLFDDNNIIETNGDYSLMKRFKSSKPCRQVKSIINTSLDTYIGWMTPHGSLKVKCCDVNGDPCLSDNEFIGESIKDKKYKVFLNHYYMKL